MQLLTRRMFDDLWPHASRTLIDAAIADQGASFAVGEINTDLRLAHFLAQASHESRGGAVLEENLNYSAERLVEVWPSRFPSVDRAQAFAHNPRALGNRVYNGRMGNRLMTDDGYIYRGRGFLQLTGRDSYINVGVMTGLDLVNHPELAIADANALKVACAVWKLRNANPGADADSIIRVTRAINGGQIGLVERRAWLAKWKTEIGH